MTQCWEFDVGDWWVLSVEAPMQMHRMCHRQSGSLLSRGKARGTMQGLWVFWLNFCCDMYGIVVFPHNITFWHLKESSALI